MTERNKIIINYFPPKNSWEENYSKIIELGKKLPKFNEDFKQDKWLIRACQSPLWLKPEREKSGRLIFTGDSEGLITKGLLALIIAFYTNRKPEDILKDKPVFIEKLQLSQFLSARRTNGLKSLLEQILQYARAFLILSQSQKSPLLSQKS